LGEANMKELVQIGVFERRLDAEQAMSSLLKAGFRHHQLGLAERRPDQAGGLVVDELTWVKAGARTAAMAGLAGTATGLLAVLGFPGFPVAVAVAMGSLFGAIVGAVLGAIAHMGVPDAEAQRCGREVAVGSTLLLIKAGPREKEARSILARNRAQNIKEDIAAVAA
jgi:hypothetical protein